MLWFKKKEKVDPNVERLRGVISKLDEYITGWSPYYVKINETPEFIKESEEALERLKQAKDWLGAMPCGTAVAEKFLDQLDAPLELLARNYKDNFGRVNVTNASKQILETVKKWAQNK